MAGHPDWKTRIDEALAAARALGRVPPCADGHGDLDLHIAKSGSFYWKCAAPDCPSYEWHREYSDMKCPRCAEPMEKVPSKKVRGGNFLKCGNRKSHADDVVMFRNRDSGEWEEPRAKQNDDVVKLRRTIGRSAVLGKPVFPEAKKIPALKLLSAVARLNGLPGKPAPERLHSQDDIAHHEILKDWNPEEIHDLADLLIDSDFLRYVPSSQGLVLTVYGANYLKAAALEATPQSLPNEDLPPNPEHNPET